ncbi:hypothetical protein BMJ34_15695 [Sinorhizobium medicae]|uniref:Uncharacterized protein n=1 Tax=Sinorhizobium medicae TaxID=110321 RepID=A0ABX4TLG8_9HYPH|nr:hypothetical protein [Sinorhizobium medicae]PLT98059.1 hypothetical protein BMJ34_15695 [Sinorhizobium medicae]PLU03778.1 hypothetical protein BMJ33_12795 [Sinorhizobium medicae]PLU17411.1 hypothetical protein BMJ29_20820 [Sinorhizobium medicae]PLU24128.1 hypothetical protein BMJ30_01740 [Sinorhizobium medicae]PLU31578.1 hypothetical protein BMJ27_21110 [Sinorhizobium medicae]
MTIAERKAREAHDRENPWRPMSEAREGIVCNLMFNDMAGHHPIEERTYFLDMDGHWYCIEEPDPLWSKPISWRPAYVHLRPTKKSEIKRRYVNRNGGLPW